MATTLQANIDATVTGAGLVIAMQTISGGEITRDVAKSRDPGATYSRAVPTHGDISNLTVGVDYDRARHGASLSTLRKAAADDTEFSISRIERDGNGNANGQITYTGIIVRFKEPEGNTNGGADKSTMELEFSISGVTG